ncbi:MAG: putative cytochrome c [Tardiphaga sp.]|nr:putative cytochrome c [Tardiphaga sp.]
MMRRTSTSIGLAFCSALLATDIAVAQMALPAAKPLDEATLFKQQCATCHAINLTDPPRQGPPLAKVVGREAGTHEGFLYSPGLAQAHFVWDESRLDAWITNPQAVVAGSSMAYRQPKPEVRAAIINYLKGLN